MRSWIAFLLFFASVEAFSQRSYDTIPNNPEHYRQRVEKFKKEAAVNGRVMFLGENLTEAGNWRKLLKDSTVLNRGISGDNTFGVLRRLDEAIKHKPSRLFLMIGINDLSANTPNEVIIENVFAIVGRIRTGSPRTMVYVQSILPVNPAIKDFPKNYSQQENILEINKQLMKYSEALKYTFLDLHGAFIDKNSRLDTRFTMNGLHLNAAGYVHWVEFLKKEKYL
jgi:lysophospholipase L1-like esterase